VPAGRRCGQEVREVLGQAAAHRGQPHRSRAQRGLQPLDGHRDDVVASGQPGGGRRDQLPEAPVQFGDHHVGPRQRHPAVGGQAVVRDALVPVARVRVADPERRHRAAAQRGGGVDRLTRRHPGEPPPGPGAEVARSLRHHRDVGAEHVPGGEQPGVHGHRLQVTAERLAGRHRPGQPARLLERRAGPREPGGQRSAVLHYVGHPGRGTVGGEGNAGPFGRKDPGQDGRESRMQVGHHDRHPADVVRVAQHVVVR
jgi:hypothetical protein